METVRVELGPRAYDVAIGHAGGVGPFVARCVPAAKLALVVADANTRPHAGAVADAVRAAGLRCEIHVVPAGEMSKSAAELATIYDALAALPADRHAAVIAVGGGVVGDLAGYAAATYNRGLPLIMIPTSLLAMVDSSVGGKTGINHAAGKNLIGAFHQPAGVWIDPAYLDTLPEREYLSGYAEIIKYGVILDPDLFDDIASHISDVYARTPGVLAKWVARSCRLKADVVEKDEHEETGLRVVLNYGHTFAHAFEAVGGYGAWLHGEAVAAGMVYAARLAHNLGRVDEYVVVAHIDILSALKLPTSIAGRGWDVDALVSAMRRDKKATAAELRFVLPTRLGHVELVDGVPEAAVRGVLSS